MKPLPDIVHRELTALGAAWRIESGTKHRKLFVEGRFAGVLPTAGGKNAKACRRNRNVIANIRRIISAAGRKELA